MAVQTDTVAHACTAIARQIRDRHKELSIHFIAHHEGQRTEALNLAAQEVIGHPAAASAIQILSKAKQTPDSALAGMAVAGQNLFGGLISRNSFLALCPLNIDRYPTLKDVRQQAYHLAWHAIDTLNYHNGIESRADTDSEITVRQRNALEIAGAHLRADIFAALMMGLQGDMDAIQRTGVTRGRGVLEVSVSQNPEHYPFIAAIEATQLVLEQIRQKSPPRKKYVECAFRTASEIGKVFDEAALKQWLLFSDPAQDMAWRGYSREQILGAAINTSEDTYVRATAYLISEVTKIKPASLTDIRRNYSPFADDAFNSTIHRKAIETVFEDIIARGIQPGQAGALIEMANKQNERLLEGHVIGWCASALQSTARALESIGNRDSDNELEALVKREFSAEIARTGWETLKFVGKMIVGEYREGRHVTLNTVADICRENRAASAIEKSIQATLRDFGLRKNQATYSASQSPALARAPAPARSLARFPSPGGGGESLSRFTDTRNTGKEDRTRH